MHPSVTFTMRNNRTLVVKNEMRTVEDAIRSVADLEFIYGAEAEVNTLRLVAVINIILAVDEVIQFEE